MAYARAVSMPKKNYSPETKKVSGYWNSTSTTFSNGSQSLSSLPDRPIVSLRSPIHCESSRSTAGPIKREPHLSQSSACEIWDVFCYFPCPKKSRKFHYGHSKRTASENYWVRTQGERCTCRSTAGPDILVWKEDICFEGKFDHPSIGEPKKHNICEVFIPEFDCSFCGIVKSFGTDDIFSVELLNFDPETENLWKKLDSPVMKWIAGEKVLRVKLCPLIRSIFGTSHPVGRGDLCTFFLPGLGSFDVYVHKTRKTECQIEFVDTSVDKSVKEAGCRLGDKFFKKSASQAHYFVKREFLKKKEVIDHKPMNVNNNPHDSSKYENGVEMLDSSEMKGFNADADFKRQNSQSEPPGTTLVEGVIDHNFHVYVLEGNIDMAEVTVDEKLFGKIDEAQFCVSEYILECVQSTTNGKKKPENTGGENAVENRDDESIEADVLKPDKEDKKPKAFVSNQSHIGRFKGIQGHNNSCYMDSLLYSLFLFNDSLDQIFALNPDDEVIHLEMKNQFKRLIVNPLRSDKGYVKQEHVMHLREMLEPYLPGVSKDEKDAEELLSVLFSKNFAGKNGYPPLLHLHNVLLNEDQHLFVYQIFMEIRSHKEFSKMQKSIPHVADILAQSFVLLGQFFKENPQTFLVQLPRFGKEKLFPGVYLPAELDISEISVHGEPICCICAEVAVLRCRECTLKISSEKFAHKSADEKFSIMTFCQTCFELCHKRNQNHQMEALQFSKPSSHSQSSSLYSLEAVICIETSHYVSFVRAKKEKPEDGFCWLFFDSMADREENRATCSEYNVPMVKAVPNVDAHLNKLDSSSPEKRYEYLASFSYTKEDELFKRLVQDAYICVYKQKEKGQCRHWESAPRFR